MSTFRKCTHEEIPLGVATTRNQGGECVPRANKYWKTYYSIKDVLVDKRESGAYVETTLKVGINLQKTKLWLTSQVFTLDDIGSFVRSDDELMEIRNVGADYIQVVRGDPSSVLHSSPARHSQYSKIYKISKLQHINLMVSDNTKKTYLRKIIPEEVIKPIENAVGKRMVIEMPVIFDYAKDDPEEMAPASSNLVNSAIYPERGTILLRMPDPYNDSFKKYVKTVLRSPFHTIQWEDCWIYHSLVGEYHCKTNASRKPDKKERWWNYEN